MGWCRFQARGEIFKVVTFCSQKVMSISNKLPKEVVNAATIMTFKGRLDKYMDRKGLWRG